MMEAAMRLMVKRSRTKSRVLEEQRSRRECGFASLQMCLIHKHFKHFAGSIPKNFRYHRKVSSSMRAKVLSIMPTDAIRVTSD